MPALHHELRVDTEMNVGALEEMLEAREQLAYVAVPGLNVDEHDRVFRLRPAVDHFDHRIAHDRAVLARRTGIALRNDGDEVQRRLHRCRGVGSLPLLYFIFETTEHVLRLELAERTHAL